MSRAYEQSRNLITSIANTATTNLISQFDYLNDPIGRRTQRLDMSASSAVSTNCFGYNIRSEVTSAQMATNSYSFLYDLIGNRIRTTENMTETEYLSNALNQYTNITAMAAPVYDLDGNTVSVNGWTYTWDAENRLIGASNGTTVLSFAYDYMSRRVSKTVNGQTRYFAWDGWNMIAETTSGTTNWYVWGLDLSGSLQGAGGVGGLLAEVKNGTNYYVSGDANGNITEYTDSTGNSAAHYEYSPFGQLTMASGSEASNFNVRFSSKYWDLDANLGYWGYRYYKPVVGRWLSKDPMGEKGGINLRAIAANDIFNYFDILGRDAAKPDANKPPPDEDVPGMWISLIKEDPNNPMTIEPADCKEGNIRMYDTTAMPWTWYEKNGCKLSPDGEYRSYRVDCIKGPVDVCVVCHIGDKDKEQSGWQKNGHSITYNCKGKWGGFCGKSIRAGDVDVPIEANLPELGPSKG